MAKKIALPVFLELPEKIFNARLDEEILFFRQEKLNSKKKNPKILILKIFFCFFENLAFLQKLTQIFKETACIEIFEFLEIYGSRFFDFRDFKIKN